MGRVIKRLWILPLILVLLLTVTVPVSAADYQQILSVKVFRHLLETDDFFVVFHYDIHYDVPVTTPISDYYHFRLMDTTGLNQLAAATPYVYFSSGYEEGAGCFYFDAASAPTWNDPLVLDISGNPEYHAAPVPEVTYTLAAGDYCAGASAEDNQEALGIYILGVAHSLQIDWSIEMSVSSESGEVLSTYGEAYFRGTLPNVQYMVPHIFPLSTEDPDYTARGWTTAQADAYATRYDGTFIGDALQGMEDMLHVDWNVITGIIITIMGLILFVVSQKMFQTTTPGLLGALVLVTMGFLMGWIAPALLALPGILLAMYVGYIFFFRNSQG